MLMTGNEFMEEHETAMHTASVVDWSHAFAQYGGPHDKITYDLMECVAIAAIHRDETGRIIDTALVHLYPNEACGVHDFFHTLKTGHSLSGQKRLDTPFIPEHTEIYIAGARYRPVDMLGLDMACYIKHIMADESYNYQLTDECLSGAAHSYKALMILGGKVFCAYATEELRHRNQTTGIIGINPDARSLSFLELYEWRTEEFLIAPCNYLLTSDEPNQAILGKRSQSMMHPIDRGLQEASMATHNAQFSILNYIG
jgi:hypothetical protein